MSGVVEEAGGRLDRVIERGGLPVDQRVGEQALGRVVLEPGVAQAAGVLALDDAVTLGVELDVVTHAPAEGARWRSSRW
jgi:hypothetical protein